MTGSVTIDVAGACVGGAARYAAELRSYVDRMGRTDVKVIGTDQRVAPARLLRREVSRPGVGRRVAVNNVSFVSPGGPRWTLLRNALHFLTEAETAQLVSKLRGSVKTLPKGRQNKGHGSQPGLGHRNDAGHAARRSVRRQVRTI